MKRPNNKTVAIGCFCGVNYMKKIFKNINGIWGVLLIIYTLCVIYLEALIDENYISSFGKLILPFAVTLFFYFIIPKIKKFELKKDGVCSKKIKFKYFILFFGISLFWLMIWYVGAFPGGLSPDSIEQYKQAVSGSYSDWHPYLQTLLVFTLPLRIFKSYFAVVLLQIIEFSLAVAYAMLTMLTYSKRKFYVFIAFAVIVFNPVTSIMILYPWKDITFAICVLMCVSFGVHIYATNGEWLRKFMNIAALAVFLCIAQCSRHNAILFTIPYLIAILFVSGTIKKAWKNKVKLIALFAVLCIFVKVPLYSAFNVQDPNRRQVEMTGLPMSIIANVVKETPEDLDDESKEFVYSIGTQEEWNKYSPRSGWNSIKSVVYNLDHIEDVSAMKILKITAKCMISSPVYAFDALIKATEMVWAISTENCYWAVLPEINDNDLGIDYQGVGMIYQMQLLLNQTVIKSWFAYPSWCVGLYMLILLTFMVSKFRKVADFRKILFCIPLFMYNFGTMLMLSGTDFRFFYYTFLITPLLIFVLTLKSENNEVKTENRIDSKLKFLFPKQ